MTDAVRVQSLVRRFGERVALGGIDLSIAHGEFFGLLGPNGGGKTTLFRILSTLLSPTSGRAEVCGFDVAVSAAAVRSRIGVVFQSPSLDKKLTVAENLRHAGHLYGLHGRPLASRIAAITEPLRLTDRLHDLVESLSGGLQRRAEIAKCLLPNPEVILMDEPSTGLDPTARIDLWTLIQQLRSERPLTVVFTTHLMEEAERAGRLAILSQGKIVALGEPSVLRDEVGGDVLRITADHPDSLANDIADALPIHPRVVEGEIRIEVADGHALTASIGAAFANRIRAISVSRPTLEDVFIARTGHRFQQTLPQ
jgi:ABC-2 type transport system ATP-binding protein